jgi:hypothetical protein
MKGKHEKTFWEARINPIVGFRIDRRDYSTKEKTEFSINNGVKIILRGS